MGFYFLDFNFIGFFVKEEGDIWNQEEWSEYLRDACSISGRRETL